MKQDFEETLEELYRAVLTIENLDDCRAFFSDLFTKQELMNFSQRLQVAKLLLQGDTYNQIRGQIAVSSSTITRINTELRFGSGGYQRILERMALSDHTPPEEN